jgi:acyl-homoserine lactone acylase PvdQ
MPRVCRAAIVLALLAATAGVQAADTVTILRDRWGVPHIFTSGRDAGDRAAYANGYAQAEDSLEMTRCGVPAPAASRRCWAPDIC